MTSLRTMWGMDTVKIEEAFGSDTLNQLTNTIQPFIAQGEVRLQDGHYYLTAKGKLIADHIASELFLEEED